MGTGGIYRCRCCGYETDEILIGFGFLSMPNHPKIREQILEGRFGERAKRILESEPDAEFYMESVAYHCQCGNIQSRSIVRIYSPSKGKQYRQGAQRCDLCGKRMRMLRYDAELKCPRCGESMEFMGTVCWDRSLHRRDRIHHRFLQEAGPVQRQMHRTVVIPEDVALAHLESVAVPIPLFQEGGQRFGSLVPAGFHL